jgi:hypothetical protein
VDPGYVVGLGVLWVLFNLFARKGKQSDQKDRSTGLRPQARRPDTLPPSTISDPTQREGVRLQDILRELGRTLDEAASQRPGQTKVGRPPTARKDSERKSLEATSEARSLEEDVQRPERAVVDADDEAEAIAARRIAAAEANARSLGSADHMAFDARIRQEPADATATKGYSMRRIRDAVVWREILGPPVSLRDRPDL